MLAPKNLCTVLPYGVVSHLGNRLSGLCVPHMVTFVQLVAPRDLTLCNLPPRESNYTECAGLQKLHVARLLARAALWDAQLL